MINDIKLFKNKCLPAAALLVLAAFSVSIEAAGTAATIKGMQVPVKSANAEAVAVVKLAQLKGRVMVNVGSSYTQASSGLILQTGAKIITTQGAAVSVLYKDGCVKQLGENSMLTVGLESECGAKNFNERVYVAAAIGDEGADLGVPTALPQAVQTSPAILTWSIGLLGSVLSQSSNTNNISKE